MRDPLRIALARPCPIELPRMGPDERERHCDHCDKRVHNLSALTEDEARGVLAEPEPICASFKRRPDGSVVFRAAVLASAAAIAACAPHSPEVAAPVPAPGCAPDASLAAPSAALREGELRVLVVDLSGMPVSKVRITLAGPAPRKAVTDAEGRVVFEGLPPGAIAWKASHNRLRNRSGTLEMQAGRGAALTVVLYDSEGVEKGMIVDVARPVIDTESGDRSHTYGAEWLERVPRGGP